MARFRYHRGSLADSLATEIQVNSLQDVEDDCNSTYECIFQVSKLECEFYCNDYRAAGYPVTYIVTVEYAHNGKRYPIGFSDELLTY